MDKRRIQKWKTIRHFLLERDAALYAARLRQEGIHARISSESVANPLPVVSSSFDLNVPTEDAEKALTMVNLWEEEVISYDTGDESYRDISKEEIFYLKDLEWSKSGMVWKMVIITILLLLLISLIYRAIVNGSTSILF